MKLSNERQLKNTVRKLSTLQSLIDRKEASGLPSAAKEMSVKSMKKMAAKLRAEINEYERAHQTA